MELACKTLCDLSTSHMCVICTGSNGKEWGQALCQDLRRRPLEAHHFPSYAGATVGLETSDLRTPFKGTLRIS